MSGTSIVVNQSGQASSTSVPALVDAAAHAATFTVAWADAGLRAVIGDPQKAHEVGIRLLDPRGKVMPEHASFVRRHLADTLVVFRIEDPAPDNGISSQDDRTDTRGYTAGVFVDSPVQLVIGTYPRRVKVGDVVQIGAVMLDGATPSPQGSNDDLGAEPRLAAGDQALAARAEQSTGLQ